MASLLQLRDAIQSTLATITGLRVHDTIPDVTNPPAVVVYPTDADFNVAMGRGVDTWSFSLYVLVSAAVTRTGQDALDAYVTGAGSSSIRAAVFANRSLGLSNVDAHVSRMTNYGAKFEGAHIDHIGAVLHLTVTTTGTA
jgi:hypothetical protein